MEAQKDGVIAFWSYYHSKLGFPVWTWSHHSLNMDHSISAYQSCLFKKQVRKKKSAEASLQHKETEKKGQFTYCNIVNIVKLDKCGLSFYLG